MFKFLLYILFTVNTINLNILLYGQIALNYRDQNLNIFRMWSELLEGVIFFCVMRSGVVIRVWHGDWIGASSTIWVVLIKISGRSKLSTFFVSLKTFKTRKQLLCKIKFWGSLPKTRYRQPWTDKYVLDRDIFLVVT